MSCGNEVLSAKRVGRIIKITVTDDEINDVISMNYNRMVFERSIDLGVTWGEITLAQDRPVLEKDKVDYTWIDRAGDAAYLYRVRYIRTDTGELGDPSETIEGGGLLTAQILPIAALKQRYLFGVDFRNDDGTAMSDSTFQYFILAAVAWMEMQLDIPLIPTTFIEKQDYYVNDYYAFNFIQLDNYPVISVEEFNVQYPSGQTVVQYPSEWLRVDKTKGHLRIVPTAGTLSEIMIGQGGAFLPAIYQGQPHLPDLFEIRYTAGFEDCKIPANILNLVGMMASFGPLNIFGELIAGAGIANLSLSIDGLSQSIGTTSSAENAGYGARVLQYAKQIKEELPKLRQFYKGIRMAVA